MNNNITYQQKLLITVLSCILAAVIAYRGIIESDIEKYKMLELEYDTAKISLDTLYEKLDDAMNTDNQEIYKNYFPDRMTSDDISLMITKLAEEKKIFLNSLKINDTSILYDKIEEKKYFSVSVCQISVSFESGFDETTEFIDSIHENNSMNVENFKISVKDDDILSVEMKLNMYMNNGGN